MYIYITKNTNDGFNGALSPLATLLSQAVVCELAKIMITVDTIAPTKLKIVLALSFPGEMPLW